MEEQDLISLIRKFLAGEASDSEKKILNDWYLQQNEKDVVWDAVSAEEEKEVQARMLKHINKHVKASRPRIVSFNKGFIRRAAAVIIGFMLLLGGYTYFTKGNKSAKVLSAAVIAPVKFLENKYVVLPDSSVVVLHSGSKIQYTFNGKKRQLSLIGEAYFDIKHKADQPFEIHTGRVITTVLGTAFNIKAYPDQDVTVSVTRGKVSVQDGSKKMLAILLPNQQVSYNEIAKSTRLKTVVSKEVIGWAKSDMQLTDMPFEQVIERLDRRYNVKIEFKNPELAKCLITGRFNGTESLDQVLQVVTETMNYSYKINGETVTVNGAGCQ